MKQSIERFLQFNGKTLLFLAKDGTNWIALKPICEALGIEYTRTFKNVSADPIIGPALAKQPMQVPGHQKTLSK
jgi:prophage antirepressor-like protein